MTKESDDLSLLIDSPVTNQPTIGDIVEVEWRGKPFKMEVGTPEWRDYQSDQFDFLVEHTEEWKFKITPDQEQRIRASYEEYRTHYGKVPDVGSLRMLISRQFTTEDENKIDVGLMVKFWSEFISDMPDLLKSAGAMHSLNMVWIDKKLNKIMCDLHLKYMEWEEQELAASVKSPESLRCAALGMEKYDQDGYSLYHVEYADSVVRWYFRKGREVNAGTDTGKTEQPAV